MAINSQHLKKKNKTKPQNHTHTHFMPKECLPKLENSLKKTLKLKGVKNKVS